MYPKRKAAGMLITSSTASNHLDLDAPILENQAIPCKDYSTLQAELALMGYQAKRCFRAHDGVITYSVTRNEQSRYYSTLHDLQAYHATLIEVHLALLAATRAKPMAAFERDDSYESDLD